MRRIWKRPLSRTNFLFRPSPNDRPKSTENVRSFPSRFVQIASLDDDTWISGKHGEKKNNLRVNHRNLIVDGRSAKSAFRMRKTDFFVDSPFNQKYHDTCCFKNVLKLRSLEIENGIVNIYDNAGVVSNFKLFYRINLFI